MTGAAAEGRRGRLSPWGHRNTDPDGRSAALYHLPARYGEIGQGDTIARRLDGRIATLGTRTRLVPLPRDGTDGLFDTSWRRPAADVEPRELGYRLITRTVNEPRSDSA